jgi:UDP-N-acetylmuramoylalanine--D-glutamate ligase
MAWDAKEEPRAAAASAHAQAVEEGRLTFGDPVAADLKGYAGVVVSPGVPINRHPIADAARAGGAPLVCDIELFAQCRAWLPAHKVIGITGTNGKSTTTALTRHLIEAAGIPVLMGGNIGLPILGQQALPAGGVYVLELSSYQIDLTQSLDCEVAMCLNVSPDHLDRYDDGYPGYVASKARLFGMQAIGNLAIVDYAAEMEDDILRFAPQGNRSNLSMASICPAIRPNGHRCKVRITAPMRRRRWRRCALGVDDAVIEAGLKSFVGLPHRMERVGQADGVLFINDPRRPILPRPRPLWRHFRLPMGISASIGFAAVCPRAMIWTNVRRGSAILRRPIRLVMQGSVFRKSSRPICRSRAPK